MKIRNRFVVSIAFQRILIIFENICIHLDIRIFDQMMNQNQNHMTIPMLSKSIIAFMMLFSSSFLFSIAWTYVPTSAVAMIWIHLTSFLLQRFRQDVHPNLSNRHIVYDSLFSVFLAVATFVVCEWTRMNVYYNIIITVWIAYHSIVRPHQTLNALKRYFQYVHVAEHDLDQDYQHPTPHDTTPHNAHPTPHDTHPTPHPWPTHTDVRIDIDRHSMQSPLPPIWLDDLKVNVDRHGQAFLDSQYMMNQHNVHASIATMSTGQTSVQIVSTDHVHDSVSKSLIARIWAVHPTIPVVSIVISLCMMVLIWANETPYAESMHRIGMALVIVYGLPTFYVSCMDVTIRLFQMNYAYLFMSITLIVPMMGWLFTWKSFTSIALSVTSITMVKLISFTIVSQLIWSSAEFIIQRSHTTGIGARFMFPTQLSIAFLQYMMFGLSPWSSMFIVQVLWIQLHNMCMVSGLYYRVWQACLRWKRAEQEEHEWAVKTAWQRIQHVMLWKYRVDLHLQDILSDWISRGLIWFAVGINSDQAMKEWYIGMMGQDDQNSQDVQSFISPIFTDHLVERWTTLIASQVIIMSIGFMLIRRWMRRDLILANIQIDTHKQLLQSLGYPSSIRAIVCRHFEAEFPELFDANRRMAIPDIVSKWCTRWIFVDHFGYYLCTIVCIVGLWIHPHVLFPGIV
jgi:hypothetical protein